jgi:hypothetical protein
MLRVTDGLLTISAADTSNICQDMVDLSVAVYLRRTSQRDQGEFHDDELWRVRCVPESSHRFVQIVVARAQTKPAMIIGTFSVVYKVAVGTHGQVTPTDLYQTRRESGLAAGLLVGNLHPPISRG